MLNHSQASVAIQLKTRIIYVYEMSKYYPLIQWEFSLQCHETTGTVVTSGVKIIHKAQCYYLQSTQGLAPNILAPNNQETPNQFLDTCNT